MKTLIAVPCMDEVKTLFMASLLGLKRPEGTEIAVSSSSLVYDARNHLAQKAVKGNFDRVLWLDSDMRFNPDLLERLSADLDEGRDFVCGLYFTRKAPIQPVVYSAVGEMDNGAGVKVPTAVSYKDYPRDSIFEIAAAGFGAVLMSVDLIKRLTTEDKLPFSPILGYSEDLSFCMRATAAGVKMYCDSRIKPDHIGISLINETTWETR